MLNDLLLPVGRYDSEKPMPDLKSGQMLIKKGDAVNFDELWVGTSRGNSLINPRTVVKTGDEPAHTDGLEWIELGNNEQPKYDFSWVSKEGKWVSADLYSAELHATSEDDMEATKLIDLPYFGVSGLEQAFYLEAMRLIIVSDVEAEEAMGHNLVSVGVGGLDIFEDENAIESTVQGSQLSGSSLRRSFDKGEVVSIAEHPVFGLRARSAADSEARSSVSGSISYRLVRELPEEPAESEAPAEG